MLTVRVYVRPVSMFHSAIYLYASADPLDPTVAWRTVGTIPKAHPSLSDVGAYGQSKWVLANGAVFVGNPEWRLIEEWTHDPLSALSTFENGTAMAAPYGVYPGTGFGLAVAASVPADGPAVVASVAPSFSPDPMVFIAAESPVFVAPSVGRDDTLFNGEAGQPVASLDMALHMACGSTAVGSANVQRIRCDAIVLLPSAAAVIPRTGVKMTHTLVSSILRLWGVREQGPNCAAFPDSGRCAAPRVWMDRGWTAGSPWPDNLERVGEEPPSSMVLVENTADVCGLWFEGPLSPTFPSRGTHFAFCQWLRCGAFVGLHIRNVDVYVYHSRFCGGRLAHRNHARSGRLAGAEPPRAYTHALRSSIVHLRRRHRCAWRLLVRGKRRDHHA